MKITSKVPRGTNFHGGRRDGGKGHFVLPDLPEHTTTRGDFGPKIRNLVPQFYNTYFTWTFVITTVCDCVHVRYTIIKSNLDLRSDLFKTNSPNL